MRRIPALAACAAAIACAAAEPRVDLLLAMDWTRLELAATATLDLASAGLRLPTGRAQAEELCDLEFPRLAQPAVLAIPVDSSRTVGDLVSSGELSLDQAMSVVVGAGRSAPSLSADLGSLRSGYRIDLRPLAAAAVRHGRTAEPPRVLEPRPTKPYTGIVVYADGVLPVRGERATAAASACLFPKIWDDAMGILYERNMVDPAVARERGIVSYVDEDASYGPVAGSDPLRIVARAVWGTRRTDLVVSRDDALRILSSEANRALLREGRVAVVLSKAALVALP